MDWKKSSVLSLVFAIAFSGLCFMWAVPIAAQTNIRLDDISLYYHGAALDNTGQIIEIDEQNARALFVELAAEAQIGDRCQSSEAQRICAYLANIPPGDINSQIDAFDFGISALIELNSTDRTYQLYMNKRLKLLRGVTRRTTRPEMKLPTELEKNFGDQFKKFAKQRAPTTLDACDYNNVPRPSGLRDFLKAKSQNVIKDHSMMQHTSHEKEVYDTDIFFEHRKTTDGQVGLCSLLQRYEIQYPKTGKKVPKMIGAICQNETTGDACFWQADLENLDSKQIEEYLDEKDDIAKDWLAGSEYRDNCTFCHSGNNAFVQYKENFPCFPNNNIGDPNSHCYRGIRGKTIPLGFKDEPLDVFLEVNNKNTCTSCHTIETTDRAAFCKMLVFVTKAQLMPPGSQESINWFVPDSKDPRLNESIRDIQKEFNCKLSSSSN